MQAKNWSLEHILLPVCDNFLKLFVPHSASIPESNRRVLLVKLDAIGDYLLFRNCLPVWSQWLRGQGLQVVLLGNPIWKSLFESWDAQWVDEVIWVNRLSFTRNPIYRFKIIRQLQKSHFSLVVHLPVHGLYRIEILSLLVGKSTQFNSIATVSTSLNATIQERVAMAKWHHILFEGNDGDCNLHSMQAFEANVAYVNTITGNTLPIQLEVPVQNLGGGSQPTLALFAGSGLAFRRWPLSHYAKVALYFLQKGWRIVLHGSQSEHALAEEIIALTPVTYHSSISNLCGHFSLSQVADALGTYQLFIGNETGITHLAAIIGLPTISLTNLHHIGLFVPYPNHCNKLLAVMTPADTQEGELPSSSFESLRKNHSAYWLSSISYQRVIGVAEKMIQTIYR